MVLGSVLSDVRFGVSKGEAMSDKRHITDTVTKSLEADAAATTAEVAR